MPHPANPESISYTDWLIQTA